MRLIADIHTHTLASGHAYGTIREMAQAAGECGGFRNRRMRYTVVGMGVYHGRKFPK